jgi:integrase
VKEAIFKTVWELKQKGLAESTVEGYGNKLKILSKTADLNCSESVREVIAQKNCGAAYKEALVNAYHHYVRVNGLAWNPPCYKRQRSLPYVACAEQINQIISRASRRYALVFSILRDTGLRPIEFHSLTLRSIDLERGVITVKSAKGGDPRMLTMKPATHAMLREYVGSHNFALDDRLFPDSYCMRHAFQRYRNDVAVKLHQPELRKIKLYDLRHFFEQGFEYVATTPKGHMLFKKLK